MNLRQRIILIVIAYPVIICALFFVAVCLSPYWYDNTITEYIPMSDRFGWAVGLSLLFYFSGWGVLLTLATIAIAVYLSKRNR